MWDYASLYNTDFSLPVLSSKWKQKNITRQGRDTKFNKNTQNKITLKRKMKNYKRNKKEAEYWKD